MVEFKAGIVVVLVVIYFVMFTASVDITNRMDAESDDTNGLSSLSLNSEFNLLGDGYCTTPRYRYNALTGEKTESSSSAFLSCDITEGVIGKTFCERLEGCSWDNVTQTYWFFWTETGSASCIGTVNHTYYDFDLLPLSTTQIASHNNTDLFGSISVCNHPTVISNKTLCDAFSCTWSKEKISYDVSYNGITSTVSDIFTFSYDFGATDTTTVFMLNFVCIVLPLLILLFALYSLIPLI